MGCYVKTKGPLVNEIARFGPFGGYFSPFTTLRTSIDLCQPVRETRVYFLLEIKTF